MVKVEMIQRGSSNMARNVLIGSISVIMLLLVLYYMKRVEVGRIRHDMDDILLQRSDREDELNRKLTEYLQKLEDMTRQLGDINSRLQECEDNKATVVMEVQKCKSVHSECLNAKETAEINLKAAQAELSRIQSQQNTVNTQLSDNNRNLANVQRSLSGAERELQQCEDEKDTCTASLRDAKGQVQECQQRELDCQANLKAAGGHQAAAPQGQGAGFQQQQQPLPQQPNFPGQDQVAPNIPGQFRNPRPNNLQPQAQPNNLQPQALPNNLQPQARGNQQAQVTKPATLVPSQTEEEEDIFDMGDHLGGADVDSANKLEQLRIHENEEGLGAGEEEGVNGGEDRVNEGGEDRVVDGAAGGDEELDQEPHANQL